MTLSRQTAAAAVGVFATIFIACGSSGGGTDGGGQETAGGACVPGQQVSCACPGSSVTGVQVCNSAGTGLGSCTGCPGSDGAAGDSSGGHDSAVHPDACLPDDFLDAGASAPTDFACTTDSDCCNHDCYGGFCCAPEDQELGLCGM